MSLHDGHSGWFTHDPGHHWLFDVLVIGAVLAFLWWLA